MRICKKNESLFTFGISSLLVAILLGRFGGEYALTNFLEGLFIGLSLVMNLSFLIRFGKERRMNVKQLQN